MKPFSIVLALLLGLSALSLVVWVGKYGGKTVVIQSAEKETEKPFPKVEDLPMPAAGPYGKAEVSETEFDFGAKNVGDQDKHIFTIKNIGEGSLAFKMGKPTCQCTVGEITDENGNQLSEGPIEPGKTINILVKWVMKNKMDKFRQVVPVFTTDPDQRTIELAVKGVVDAALHLSPEGLWDLGLMSNTEPSKAEGFISSKVVDEFTVEEVPRENGRVKVAFEPVTQEEAKTHGFTASVRVMVVVPPDVPVGQFRETIQLLAQTPNGELPLEFMVGGRKTGPIEVRGVVGANFNIESNRLFFGEFPASSGKKAKLNFIVKDMDEELVLKSVLPADTRIKFHFPETGKVFGKSKSYQVEIEIPPGPPARHRQDQAEKVDLNFNHPYAPDFTMTVDYNAI